MVAHSLAPRHAVAHSFAAVVAAALALPARLAATATHPASAIASGKAGVVAHCWPLTVAVVLPSAPGASVTATLLLPAGALTLPVFKSFTPAPRPVLPLAIAHPAEPSLLPATGLGPAVVSAAATSLVTRTEPALSALKMALPAALIAPAESALSALESALPTAHTKLPAAALTAALGCHTLSTHTSPRHSASARSGFRRRQTQQAKPGNNHQNHLLHSNLLRGPHRRTNCLSTSYRQQEVGKCYMNLETFLQQRFEASMTATSNRTSTAACPNLIERQYGATRS